MLRTTIATALGAILVTGCMAAPAEEADVDGDLSNLTRDEARAMAGKGDHGIDLCEILDWYGDGICDEFCTHPDPDCAAECRSDADCPQPYCLPGGPCPHFECVAGECVQGDRCDAGERECQTCNGNFVCAPNSVSCPLVHCPPPPPPPANCGGFAGFTCPADQFCDYADDSCGYADAMGTCMDIPDAWIEIYAPVCGCDGVTYSNTGEAHGNAVDVAHDGACTPPPPPPTDCRTDGCGTGEYCSWCWGSFACIPDGALC